RMLGNDRECTSCPQPKSFLRRLFHRRQFVESSYWRTLQSLIAFAHHLSRKLEMMRLCFGSTTLPSRVVLLWRILPGSHYEAADRHNTAESCTGALQDSEESVPAIGQKHSVVIV